MKTREEFIRDNIGLVHACANKFRNKGIEYDDLFQAGSMGMVKAYDNFDTSRGFQFSTYAVPVILGEIKRLFREGGTVKVSRSLKELSLKINWENERYQKEFDHLPSVDYLAKQLEVDEFQILQAMEISMPVVSLTNQDDGFDNNQIDIPVEAESEKLVDMISLKEVLGKLNAEDRTLIVLRYLEYQTQSQVANVLGITQVQVSRREKKILESLRKMLV